jgi:hypothetical protein
MTQTEWSPLDLAMGAAREAAWAAAQAAIRQHLPEATGEDLKAIHAALAEAFLAGHAAQTIRAGRQAVAVAEAEAAIRWAHVRVTAAMLADDDVGLGR